MANETYPPRKYFFIKEQARPEEYLPKNSIPIPTDEEVIDFLGEPPTEEDLPDWLQGFDKEDKIKTDWGRLFDEYGDRFIPIFYVLAKSKLLSSLEFHLYILIRGNINIVPPNTIYDYFKIPVTPVPQTEYAEILNISVSHCKRLFKTLEKIGLIIIKRQRGKRNEIWLRDLRELLPFETRKLPSPERCIRTLVPKRGKE